MKKNEKIAFLQGYLGYLKRLDKSIDDDCIKGMCHQLIGVDISDSKKKQYRNYIFSVFFRNKSYIKKLIIDANYINSREKIDVHIGCINNAYKNKWTSYYLMPVDINLRIKFVKYLLKKLK